MLHLYNSPKEVSNIIASDNNCPVSLYVSLPPKKVGPKEAIAPSFVFYQATLVA